MTIVQSRKALRIAIIGKEKTDIVAQIIKFANGDQVMIDAFRKASEALDLGIRRLCQIIPNADILYEEKKNGPMLPGTVQRHADSAGSRNTDLYISLSDGHDYPTVSWCNECERPAQQCPKGGRH